MVDTDQDRSQALRSAKYKFQFPKRDMVDTDSTIPILPFRYLTVSIP